MTGYVRPQVGYVQARPDTSGLRAEYVWSQKISCSGKINQESRQYGA
jgi:hypothetical protein